MPQFWAFVTEAPYFFVLISLSVLVAAKQSIPKLSGLKPSFVTHVYWKI